MLSGYNLIMPMPETQFPCPLTFCSAQVFATEFHMPQRFWGVVHHAQLTWWYWWWYLVLGVGGMLYNGHRMLKCHLSWKLHIYVLSPCGVRVGWLIRCRICCMHCTCHHTLQSTMCTWYMGLDNYASDMLYSQGSSLPFVGWCAA